jgi:hypothetical protein
VLDLAHTWLLAWQQRRDLTLEATLVKGRAAGLEAGANSHGQPPPSA